MTIITRNRDFMFTTFSKDGIYYMTVVAGSVAQYDVTVTLSEEEIHGFEDDSNKLIALAKDVANRTSAYSDRLVTPSIDQS